MFKRADLGILISELCRQHGISEPKFYWKAKYAGMTVSEARRLEQ